MGDDVETERRTAGRTDRLADEERSSDAAFSRQPSASRALPVGSPHSVGGCRSETGGRRTASAPPVKASLWVGRCRRARGRATRRVRFTLHTYCTLFSRRTAMLLEKSIGGAEGGRANSRSHSAINDTAVGRLPRSLAGLVGWLVGDLARASAHIVRDMKLFANSIRRPRRRRRRRR